MLEEKANNLKISGVIPGQKVIFQLGIPLAYFTFLLFALSLNNWAYWGSKDR